MVVVCFLADVARDTKSTTVTAWSTPSLKFLMTFFFSVQTGNVN